MGIFYNTRKNGDVKITGTKVTDQLIYNEKITFIKKQN